MQNFGISFFNNKEVNKVAPANVNQVQNLPNNNATKPVFEKDSLLPYNVANLVPMKVKLETKDEIQKYNEISSAISNGEFAISPQDNVPIIKKLDMLLKSGKLLNASSNDKSTTLDNLYSILTTKRTLGLNGAKIVAQTIDAIYDPTIITQNFGDIPKEVKNQILSSDEIAPNIKVNPDLMDVEGSGTCVAASIEFHMANKHPAEFSRWIEGLTSEKREVNQTVKLTSLSKNLMDAASYLNLFETHTKNFNFDYATLALKPDDGAYVRAQVQDKFWDKKERTIVDVLMQSTLMQLGSQGCYDSITDMRGGKLSANPKGLIETEKTFIESIVENNEKLAIQYQKVDDDQNLIGWECSFDKIQDHIIQNLNTGEDVIVGYVLTNETSGATKSATYKNTKDNAPNKIINGHEITIVDYKTDANGKVTFICNDTDDDEAKLIEYSADYLIPKIHHAAYPVAIVENDVKAIEAQKNKN